MEDEQIKSYIGSPTLWGDDMHRHFETYGRWDWFDVKQEGSRVYGLMFDCEVEDDSPIDDIISAVAAQAYDGAMSFVAAFLGIPVKHLMMTVSEWSEDQDNLPPPVASMELFNRMIRK